MASINDIPSVDEVLSGFNSPPQRASTPAFKNALGDLARAVKSGGDTRAATRKALDIMPGKTERTKPGPYDRAQRLKALPQTLRQLRANHKHPPGRGWRTTKATVRQWAKDMSDQKIMDFSGSSTCCESFIWEQQPGESGADALGTLTIVFVKGGGSYSYPDVSRSDAIEGGSSSEGRWFNESGLYYSYA